MGDLTTIISHWAFAVLAALVPGCDDREEDETNIYWNAEACGNGLGVSWVSVEIDSTNDLVVTLEQ